MLFEPNLEALDSNSGSTMEKASRTCEVHCKQNLCEAIWSALTLCEEQLTDEKLAKLQSLINMY